jgi:hypothetical protein
VIVKMEKKGLPLVILGIVAVIAIVGLVLLFKTAMSGAFSVSSYGYGADKVYIGTGQGYRVLGSDVIGVPVKDVGQNYGPIPVVEAPTFEGAGPASSVGKSTWTSTPSWQTNPCGSTTGGLAQVSENPALTEFWVGDTPCRYG